MKIFLDAMGGDNAPRSTVSGAIEALNIYKDLIIVLGGPLETVNAELSTALKEQPEDIKKRIEVVSCEELISNDESPVMAIRQKKNSAIVEGMLLLKEKKVDAFVSAGSTGAVLAGGMFRLGRIKGIDRPAIATLLPNGKSQYLLLDSGANVDCRPQYLLQFATMGKAYMQGVKGIENPRIGLVNIGVEEEKGNLLNKESYVLLKEQSNLNFIGNVEARDIPSGIVDVVVCDGFVGNIILKFLEGIVSTLMGMIKTNLLSSFVTKIGAFLSKPAFKKIKKELDHDEVGGAPLLGVMGNVIKAHGSSSGHAIACAIRQAVLMINGDIVSKIQNNLKTKGE